MKFAWKLFFATLFVWSLFIFSFQSIEKLELPAINHSDLIIQHKNYTLRYDTTLKLARWVAYQLTSDELVKTAKRKNNFKPDPLLQKYSADLLDYKGGEYDRGHLAPAGDMTFSVEAMNESFYLTNIAPQNKNLNRGKWNQLEELVRKWVRNYHNAYIVTGPLVLGKNHFLGKNKIAIPTHFYKTVLIYTEKQQKMIAFLLPNTNVSDSLQKFCITVDSLEEISKLNLYEKLEDKLENKLEHTMDLNWEW